MEQRESGDREMPRWDSRRRFLAAAAGIAVGAVAGCSSVTDQEFEATPAVLPEAARGELAVTEVFLDSATVSREVEQVDGEITITNHAAAYARGPDRGSFEPALIEEFIGQVNGTDSIGPAAVVSGDKLDGNEGIMDLEGADYDGLMDFIGQNYDGLMDFIGQDYLESVTANRVSLVTPAGLRSDSETKPEIGQQKQTFLLLSPSESDEFNPPRGHPMYVVDAEDFLPPQDWPHLGRKYEPGAGWFPPGQQTLPEPDDEVLVVLGENTPEGVFGVPAAEMPGERVEAGDAEQPFNPFLIAAPGGLPLDDQSPVAERYKNFFDAGVPAPTSATFGVGALSTPAAEVAGQSANPLAHVGLKEILGNEQVRRWYTGADDLLNPGPAFDVPNPPDWLAGPLLVVDNPDATSADNPDGTTVPLPIGDSPDGTTIVDQDTDLKSFVGVLSSDHGPVGLGAHVARVQREGNVVIVTGAHGWPVGSAEYFDNRWFDNRWFTGILGSIIVEARTLTAEAGKRFILNQDVDLG